VTLNPRMAALFSGIHHVALATAEAPAAAAFYQHANHFVPWAHAQHLNLGGNGHMLCGINAGLLLLNAASGQKPLRLPVSESGITHLCLQTPSINTVYGALATVGASFHCKPIDLGTGYLYTYARDPEFNVVEIECVAPVWDDPQPWIAHVNIATHDLDRLIGFYAALLGVTAARSPRLRNDARLDAIADLPNVQLRMAWLQASNMQIELMQYLEPATRSHSVRRQEGACGYAHIAFEVADLGAALDHLRVCGGSVPVHQTGDWRAVCHDPDGNPLWLLALSHPSRQGASIQHLREPSINQRFNERLKACREAQQTPA
jgi:catechol 2,3-dioxygenase-like lactoylglutathione lyase family enzyme